MQRNRGEQPKEKRLEISSRKLDTKGTTGTFHAKMGTIKDRNSKGLTEAEATKKRWQEYTELYRKGLNEPDDHDGVVTHLETNIWECEVKRALGSITMNKASGGDGIHLELFQILKDDAVALTMPANLENSAVPTGPEKVSFLSNSKERQAKECSNDHTIALISHTSKVMLKILQARLQLYVN